MSDLIERTEERIDERMNKWADAPAPPITDFFREYSDILPLFGIVAGLTAIFPRFLPESSLALEAGVSGSLLMLVVLSLLILSQLLSACFKHLIDNSIVQFSLYTTFLIGLGSVSFAVTSAISQYLPYLLPLFDKVAFFATSLLYMSIWESDIYEENINNYHGKTHLGVLSILSPAPALFYVFSISDRIQNFSLLTIPTTSGISSMFLTFLLQVFLIAIITLATFAALVLADHVLFRVWSICSQTE